MKKLCIAFITTFTALSLFAGCKTGPSDDVTPPPPTPSHTHAYTEQIVEQKYLKKPATCTSKAQYYYSCVCGATDTDFFLYGNVQGHSGGIATETAKAVCEKCGESYGEYAQHEHLFDKTVANDTYKASNATCEIKATYYYSCACGEKDQTRTFESGNFADCADNDNDHLCDICDKELTTCQDSNNDHKCDTCDKELSTCKDRNNDHKCDTCDKELTTCKDDNNDHLCDICEDKLTDCKDDNNDHDCDICGKELTTCKDGNNDHSCDICGEELTTCQDSNNDHNCDICGATISTHIYNKEIASEKYQKSGATCAKKATYYYSCVCGAQGKDTFEIGNLRQHDFSGAWVTDEQAHWHTCAYDDCNETDEKIPHSGGTATATQKAACEICGEGYGDYLDYSYQVVFADEMQWVIVGNDTYNKTIECAVMKNSIADASITPKFTFADPTIARLDGNTLIGLNVGVTTLTAEYKGQTDTMRIEVLEELGPQVTATDSTQVKSFGRAYSAGTNNDHLRFINTASGFEINFIGSAVTCYINFDVYEAVSNGLIGGLKIYLDGEPFYYYKTNVDVSETAITLAGAIPYGFHTIKVLKMTEQALAQCEVWGLTTDGKFVTPFAHKELLFEFYGDSITCGYGNLPDSEGMIYAQDGTNTYASIASEYFGAEYECVSYSGLAVAIPNGSVHYTVQDIFDRYHEQKRDVYDMSQTSPDVVIVALGTNDSFGMEKGGNGAFVKKYVEFIKALREKRPNVPILCIYGMMWTGGNELETENCIKLAIDELRKDGVEKVYYSRVEANLTGKDAHPDAAGHQQAATQLIELIKQYGELDGYPLTATPKADDANIAYTNAITENVKFGDTVTIPSATAKDYDNSDISDKLQILIGYCDDSGNLLQWTDSYMQTDSPTKSLIVKDYAHWLVQYSVVGGNGNTVIKELRFTAQQSATPIVYTSTLDDIVATVGSTFTTHFSSAMCNDVDVSANIELWIYRMVNGERELVEMFPTGGAQMEMQLPHGVYELVYTCKDDLGNRSAERVINLIVNRLEKGTQLLSQDAIAKNADNAVWNTTTNTLDVGVTSTSTNTAYSQVTFDNDKYGMDDIIKVTFSIDSFVNGGEQLYTMGTYGSKTYHQYMPGGYEAFWPPFFSIRITNTHVGLVTGQLNLNGPYVEREATLADGAQHTIAWQIVKTGENCDADDASIVMRCWIDCEPTQAPSIEIVCTANNYEKYYFDRLYNEGDGWLYFGSVSTGNANDCIHIYKAELC